MDILTGLKRTKADTLPHFELDEAELAKCYAPGKWSVRELLHHLADAETVLYERIRRVISEPRPVVWAFDPDAWAEHLKYRDLPLEPNKNVYSNVRDAIIVLAERHYEEDGNLEFVHSNLGVRTLAHEFDKVVWHNERHLQQIEQALKG